MDCSRHDFTSNRVTVDFSLSHKYSFSGGVIELRPRIKGICNGAHDWSIAFIAFRGEILHKKAVGWVGP